jgi:tetratricopeptide (TPR) repeat protein
MQREKVRVMTRMITRLRLLVVLPLLFAGCSRDPNVRKQKYLESGERYFAKAEYPAASIQFRNALQVDPQFSAAHYQLARTYLKVREWDNAFQELQRTIELEPQNFPARLDLANLLLAAAQLKPAQEQLDLLLTRQPDNADVDFGADVHLAEGNLLAAERQLPDAIKEIQRAISADPQRADSYLGLAELQLRNNQPDAAEANFKKSAELSPKAINAQLALGGYYQSRQRFTEAEQQFVHASEVDRQDPNPRIALARLYLAEGKKKDAEEFLRRSKSDFSDNSVGYRLLGDFYFAAGNLDDALAEYSELSREHPKDPVVTNNYVQILILKNRLDEARKLNDGALRSSPGDVDALIERGQIQTAEGHLNDAVETLQTAIKNDPNNGLAYYHLGIAFDRLKNPGLAEKAWQDAVRHRADLVVAHRALLLVALRNGDMAELERRSTEVIELQPTAPDGYAMRALSRIRREQLSQAEPDVQKAISVAPENPIGYLQMGNLMLARKDYHAAEEAFRQALGRDGRSPDALSGLMNTYFAERQPANALRAAQAQIAKVPGSSAFYDLLGTALFDHKRNQQDLSDAEAALEKSVQLDDHNVDAWLKLIEVQAVRDSAEQALASCRHALETNPDSTGVYLLTGELHNSRLEWDQAKQAFQKALALSPEDPAASNDLAYVMLQTGENPDLAIPLAETARRGMPDSPQAADTMGWALYQKGAYSSAIHQFHEALKLAEKAKSPDNPTVHYHLGLAYERSGQLALARQQLQQVLKINPDYVLADDVRKHLSQLRG